MARSQTRRTRMKKKKASSEIGFLAAGSSLYNCSQKASIQFNIAPKTTFAGSSFECGWLFQVLFRAKVLVLKELDRKGIGLVVY